MGLHLNGRKGGKKKQHVQFGCYKEVCNQDLCYKDLLFLYIKGEFIRNKNVPLLNSIHSKVLLLQTYLVRYEQQLLLANVSTIRDIAV